MSRDKIADRIAKLLRKAESAREIGNEAEAEVFASKVRELLVKHKLEISELPTDVVEREDPLGHEYIDSPVPTRRRTTGNPTWVVVLADAVARAYFCRVLYVGKENHIMLIGRDGDRRVAMYVLERLVRFIEDEAKRRHSKLRYRLWRDNDGDMSAAHGFKKSFRSGATHVLEQRLRELRQEPTDRGTALVLRRSDEELERILQKFRPENVTFDVDAGSNILGLHEGANAGHRADITANSLDARADDDRVRGELSR